MKFAALAVALATVVVGIVGFVSPDSITTVRRLYFATPARLYVAAVVRLAMGLVVLLSAKASRAPNALRVLGALMCMQALTATVLGPDRAQTVLEWETMRGTSILRVGAAVAVAAGGFIAFAVTGRRPESGRN
jgi:hypothetical protein